MGKKRKGSNKRGNLDKMTDAVSDDEGPVGDVPGEDFLYDEVDTWANDIDKELIKATKKAGKRGKSRVKDDKREIFALSGTDSDSDLELPVVKKKKKVEKVEEMFEDDIAEEEADEDLRAWGKKKKQFYGGNEGGKDNESDLESDLEEDRAEQREAEILQLKQLENLQEEDFLDTFATISTKPKPSTDHTADINEDTVTRDLSKLSRKEQLNLFKQSSPEFDGIVLDFQTKMSEAVTILAPIANLFDSGSLPSGPIVEYVRAKLHLVLNYCVNILAYLMFKSKGVNLKLHPVTGRLVQYKQLLDSLQDSDKIVMPQVENLLNLLANGESIDAVVKQAKRRAKKRLMKSKKSDQLKLLDKKEVESGKVSSQKPKIANTMEGLTGDERIAVELYEAIKKNKGNAESDSSEDEKLDNMGGEGIEDNIEDEEEEEEGKRSITYQIAKNKGLTPKRSKLQRNPRVKHRVKYAKAKVKRKGAVREVRTEVKKYSGEMFGINARVKKGVKIN